MTDTEERTIPPVAAPAGETEKPAPKAKRLGPVRYFLSVVSLAAVCAFSLSQSGILDQLKASAESSLTNLNTASVDELKDLPEVNKKVAEAIISQRPFKAVEDLLKVKGIGEKKLEKIREFVTVE